MDIIPAIDIKDGNVVRLTQGRFDDVTVYSKDPLIMAELWIKKGAKCLHLVDLDGAKYGEMRNFGVISKIAQKTNIPVQVGGGIRTKEDIASLINAGVKRVILSTRIIDDLPFLAEAIKHWPDNIAVSLDCSYGKIAQRGWTSVTDIQVIDFAIKLENMGLPCIIYTDIKRDGMMSGPNVGELRELLTGTTMISVIASGGLSNIKDVSKLISLKSDRLIGAITGKAIYEGTLDLELAVDLCSQNE